VSARQIEERLNRLEQQVAELRRQSRRTSTPKDRRTWRDFVGMFHNDRDFGEAMKIGAAYRRSTLKPKRKTRKS